MKTKVRPNQIRSLKIQQSLSERERQNCKQVLTNKSARERVTKFKKTDERPKKLIKRYVIENAVSPNRNNYTCKEETEIKKINN